MVVARLSEVYGPNSLHWTIRPVELIRWHLMWVPPEAGVLSPLYIDDAIDGIIALAEHPEAPGEIFQISGSEMVSVYHFSSAYADAMDIRLHRTLPGGFKRLAVAERIAAPVAKRPGLRAAGHGGRLRAPDPCQCVLQRQDGPGPRLAAQGQPQHRHPAHPGLAARERLLERERPPGTVTVIT